MRWTFCWLGAAALAAVCGGGGCDGVVETPGAGGHGAGAAGAGGSGAGVSDAGVIEDAAADAPPDGVTGDASDGDAGQVFPGVLKGIWLIGWTGGLNHFSWVRFREESELSGPADFLSGEDLSFNVPFWDCTGTGHWFVSAMLSTIWLQPPESCGIDGGSYTFVSFHDPQGYAPGATLAAHIDVVLSPGGSVEGYKYPDSQCDPMMTSCADPFLP